MCVFARRSVATILSVLLLPAAAFAQAAITGVVRDTSGAVLPGVTVEAASPVLIERTRSVVSDDTGQYRIVDLRPGTYSVTAELPGFKKSTLTGILLQVGDARTLNMILEAGNVSENVTVVAEAPLMDLTTAKIGAVVESRQILELPLLGRNAMSLFYLQAGTNPLDAAASSQQQRGGVDGLAPSHRQFHSNQLGRADATPEVTETLRARFLDGMSFEDLVEQVRQTSIDAFEHDEIPFESLVAELSPRPDVPATIRK